MRTIPTGTTYSYPTCVLITRLDRSPGSWRNLRIITGGREPEYFFDKDSIGGLDDWQNRVEHASVGSSLFLAFLSPNYLVSEWCRREFREWLDVEISKHILSEGTATIYIHDVEGFLGGKLAKNYRPVKWSSAPKSRRI